MRVLVGSLCVILLAYTLINDAAAASWPPDGRAIAEHGIPPNVPACISCHRSSFAGHAAKGAPSLLGKPASGLMDDLATEADSHKQGGKMTNIAKHLNMAERAAVTAYIASLSPAAPKS
jgi:cytochrome c553